MMSQRESDPIRLHEITRYFFTPLDLILPFFQSGTSEHRKQKRKLFWEASNGNLEARYRLGHSVYKYALDMPIGFERTIHFRFAQRLLYKVHRLGGRYTLAASTIYGSIAYLEGNLDSANFFWDSAARRGGTSAMYQLAILAKRRKDRALAIEWLKRASAKGHLKSAELLERMQIAPAPNHDLDPRSAELHIEEWMAHWGFHDAKATPVGPDGGFDVKSRRAAAQVKFRGQPTPLDQINSFHGACDRRYEYEIFVSKGGFTKPAREAANEYGMALFQLSDDGTPLPINTAAHQIYKD